MSAQTPPDDGFGLYLATIAGDDRDDELDELPHREYAALFDYDDPPEDETCEECGEFQDACDCLYAGIEETDDTARTGGDDPRDSQRDAHLLPPCAGVLAGDDTVPDMILCNKVHM